MSAALDTPNRGDNRGLGSGIGRLREHLKLLALADPEAIRTEVIARGREPFINGIVDTLNETSKYCYSCHRGGKERWAFRLYAELAKLVGSGPEITLQIMALVGASAPIARGAVEVQRRVESASPEDMLRAAFETLDEYCAERGLTVEQARAKMSGAEVVEGTNGGPHG